MKEPVRFASTTRRNSDAGNSSSKSERRGSASVSVCDNIDGMIVTARTILGEGQSSVVEEQRDVSVSVSVCVSVFV